MRFPFSLLATAFIASIVSPSMLPAQDADLLPGGVAELHMMVPMRDGVRLSVYLYITDRQFRKTAIPVSATSEARTKTFRASQRV